MGLVCGAKIGSHELFSTETALYHYRVRKKLVVDLSEAKMRTFSQNLCRESKSLELPSRKCMARLPPASVKEEAGHVCIAV